MLGDLRIVVMIDRKHIGHKSAPFDAELEKGRLRLFAKATGQTDPIYFDESAAQAAGYRSILMPPTFLFCLEMEQEDPYRWFQDIGIPVAHALHGEQAFRYYRSACAGETMRFQSQIVDIYDKKNGALEFIVQDVKIHNQDGQAVADFRRTVVIRHPDGAAS